MDIEEFEGTVSECKVLLSLVNLIPEEIEDKHIVQETEVWFNQRGDEYRRGDFLSLYDDLSNQNVEISSKHDVSSNHSSQLPEM